MRRDVTYHVLLFRIRFLALNQIEVVRELRLFVELRRVFAQGMPQVIVRQQEAARVRMTLKADAHQVPHFALVPVSAWPDACHTRHSRLFAAQPYFQAQFAAVFQRIEVVVHRKARMVGKVIDRADVRQQIELQGRIVAQERADFDQTIGPDDQCRFAAKLERAGDCFREFVLEGLYHHISHSTSLFSWQTES